MIHDEPIATTPRLNAICRDELQALAASGGLPQALERLGTALQAAGMSFEGRAYYYNPAPLLISEHDAVQLCRKAEGLAAILEHVGRLYAEEDAVRLFFRSYASLEGLTLAGYPLASQLHLNRFDTVWQGGGNFKVLEPNCCCPAGVTSNAMTRRAWRSVPEFARLVAPLSVVEYPIDDETSFASSLAQLARSWTADAPFVALANYRGSFTFELDWLRDILRDLGCRSAIADLADFRFANGKLMLGDEVVDLVYNKLDQLMLRERYDHLPYFDAYRRQTFIAVNSFRSQIILEDKAVLALLSDERFGQYFTAAERALITDHIPWTRYVRDEDVTHPDGVANLLRLARGLQGDLVLKPTNQTRGSGIVIGRDVSAAEWDAGLVAAVGGEWIVQEYCALPIAPGIAQHGPEPAVEDWSYSLDIFVVAGEAIGLTSRSNANGVINVGSGGMRRPVCVVR